MGHTMTSIAEFEFRRLILDAIGSQGDRVSREAFSAGERGSKIEVFLASTSTMLVTKPRQQAISSSTYSDGANGLAASGLRGKSVSHGETISSSVGVISGLGEATATSVTIENGALCGRGEMSIDSGARTGEED